MASRDQQRAARAYEDVSRYLNKDEASRKKYATMVYKLPSLLQTAGLCQTLHFAAGRSGGKDGDSRAVVEHLAGQLHRVNGVITNADSLLERARRAELAEYLALTDEAMACAAWYRRLVQGVLKIDPSDAGEGDT